MSRLATEVRGRRSQRGNALISTLVVMVAMAGLLYAASGMSAMEGKQSRASVDETRSRYVAQAGVERAITFLGQAVKNTLVHDPLHGISDLFTGGTTFTPFVGQPIMNGTRREGAYTISLTLVSQTANDVTIAINSTGYVPDAPTNLAANQQIESWSAVRTTVKYELAPSKVFDYAYFINNWGWFYGNTIYANGNVRSNGQFDAAGYSPTITGEPLYDNVAWNGSTATLSGYQDDNNDGLTDGNDGGLWSGWDIINAGRMRGNGGHATNQHDFQPPVEMPNLTDLTLYETSAKTLGGSITIGGATVSDAVYGDGAGEKQNLFLVGTAANPITLHGPVVVRGNVVIKGYVTGQGAIYSGGNVYVPDSVRYVNGPTTSRPTDNTQAATQTWLTNNWNKDFLGLFARENVVVGDCTDGTWQWYTSWWMGDSMNASAEDSGSDNIPNTRAGRDGILGTADDDVLEGDGVFTVEHYTADDAALGLIPPGKNVGDAIPGTGEDIDGDGQYDGTTNLSNVVISLPLTSGAWGGNLPAGGVSDYHSISSMYANRLDATFYTNHSFCWTVLGGEDAKINGALVSRNENIIYGTPTMQINHDVRLLGGAGGMASKLLPIAVKPVQVLRWEQLDQDPNRYVVNP